MTEEREEFLSPGKHGVPETCTRRETDLRRDLEGTKCDSKSRGKLKVEV